MCEEESKNDSKIAILSPLSPTRSVSGSRFGGLSGAESACYLLNLRRLTAECSTVELPGNRTSLPLIYNVVQCGRHRALCELVDGSSSPQGNTDIQNGGHRLHEVTAWRDRWRFCK